MSTLPTLDTLRPVQSSESAAALGKRTVKRASLAEINTLDLDTIRERFAQSRRDDRGPVEKALDLLDYPRNQIAAMIAPGLERQARERGDVGAFGTGKVFGSDVLKAAGIENRVARAVLGFGADVLVDPLTYIGPAGWGLKATNAAGQGVRVGLRGQRAIKGGLKAVQKGGLDSVADPTTAALFRASGKATAPEIGSAVLGSPTGGKVGQVLSRVGGEQGKKGGILGESFDKFGLTGQAAEQADAARGFVAKYGKGSAPGIRIGRDPAGKLRITVGQATPDGPVASSTIAHIPFTEWGIHVPGFTGDGKAAGDALRIATSTGRVDPVRAAGPIVAGVAGSVREMQRVADAQARGFLTAEDATEQMDGFYRSIDQALAAGGNRADPENIGDLLALKKLIHEGESAAEWVKAKMDAGVLDTDIGERLATANMRYADAVKGSVKQFANGQDEAMVRIAQRLLETDDEIMGASVLTPFKTAASAAGDPGIAVDLANRADNYGRKVLGQPVGQLRSQARYLRNTLTAGSREVHGSIEREIRQAVGRAMDDAGMDLRTAEDYEKATNVGLALMYLERNAQARSLGQPDVFWTKKFGSQDDADWVRLLSDAQKSGYFSQQPTGSVADHLRPVAQKYAHALDTLGSEEYADNILASKLKGYIPTVATPEARFRIGANRKYALVNKPKGYGAAAKAEQESFQKHRSTLQYRFMDDAGSAKRFFEKDRWVQDFSPAELEAVRTEDPASAARIRDLQTTIAEYDQKAQDPQWARANQPRNTDPWELNEMARNGDLSLLIGGDDLATGFADTNIATTMASRFMSHERAVARRTWLEYVKQFGVTVDPAKMQGEYKNGQDFVLKDGSVAKFFRDPKAGVYGFEQMGQRYRPLSSDVLNLKQNPLLEAMGNTTAKVYHDDVARQIEDLATLYEEDPAGLLRGLDAITGAWKTATLFSPTWTVGNVAGDGINYILGGAKIADMAKQAKPIGQIIANTNNPEALRGLSVNIRGVDIPAEQFVADLRNNRLLGTNKHAETALQLINRKFFTMASTVTGAEGRGGSGAIGKLKAAGQDFSPKMLKGDFLQRLSHETAGSKGAKVGKAAWFVARDRLMRRVIAPWFRANEKVSDYMRALAYASFLEQGNDIPAAAQRTVRAGFDYSDLSRVERGTFRRIFPFYSWMRLNGAYQIKLLMERPIYAGSFPLLQNAIEEAIAGDQQVPLHARPAWMRNQLAVMVGSDPEERFALLLGSTLPTEQALMASGAFTGIEGAQDFAKYLLTSINPVIRAPAEFAAGREFFSGRTIDPEGDITPGQFAAGQFRPTREAGKIAQTLQQQGVGPAIARFTLGGRVQNASDDRLYTARLREFQDQERKIQVAVRRADKNQDVAARAVAGAKLLALYDQMRQAGFESDVPRWARDRLATLA